MKSSSNPIDEFIRRQGITTAIINMVVNPILAWLLNRKTDFIPLSGGSCIIADTVITCMILSVLVALFAASGIKGYLKTASAHSEENFPFAGKLISLLPRNAWAAGLVIGVIANLIIVPAVTAIFHMLGITGLSLAGFALFKAIYTGPLSYIVNYLVMNRQKN